MLPPASRGTTFELFEQSYVDQPSELYQRIDDIIVNLSNTLEAQVFLPAIP